MFSSTLLPAMPEKSGIRKPTDAEFKILSVIWDRQSTTVREVFNQLSENEEIGYTTVLKLMQIMTDKGLLKRDTSVKPQVYKAAVPQKKTQGMLLNDLLDRAFSGAPGPLVLQALSIKKSSPEELRQIREMLDKLEGKNS
jgi:predicted transcriptional regulator|tara:strand:+ start:48 stop:467 length:420 start_codon:yes stop_codon:yes gene_type:complete